MAAQQNFRTALNGFNREDVVRYIEQLNAKHSAQVNNLTAELEYLHSQQSISVPASGEKDALIEQQAARIRELFDRCRELEAQLEALKSGVALPTAPAPNQELEAYRRAERAERLAMERAQNMHQQMNGALADTTVRLEEASAKIDAVSQNVLDQLETLRCTIHSSKQVLKDAASGLYSLRCDNQE